MKYSFLDKLKFSHKLLGISILLLTPIILCCFYITKIEKDHEEVEKKRLVGLMLVDSGHKILSELIKNGSDLENLSNQFIKKMRINYPNDLLVEEKLNLLDREIKYYINARELTPVQAYFRIESISSRLRELLKLIGKHNGIFVDNNYEKFMTLYIYQNTLVDLLVQTFKLESLLFEKSHNVNDRFSNVQGLVLLGTIEKLLSQLETSLISANPNFNEIHPHFKNAFLDLENTYKILIEKEKKYLYSLSKVKMDWTSEKKELLALNEKVFQLGKLSFLKNKIEIENEISNSQKISVYLSLSLFILFFLVIILFWRLFISLQRSIDHIIFDLDQIVVGDFNFKENKMGDDEFAKVVNATKKVGEVLRGYIYDQSSLIKSLRNGKTNYKMQTSAYSGVYAEMADNTNQMVDAFVEIRCKLEEALKARSTFLSSISHEIRTPMNAIVGMSELLSETELNETQKNYVENFQSASSTLLALINDVLDISKIESGMMNLEKTNFNMNNLIQKTILLFESKAKQKNIEITFKNSLSENDYLGDPTRLMQIFLNLLSNAIKFTENGKIEIEISQKEKLLFSLRDTGIGMNSEQLKGLFTEFYQADSSIHRKYGGTGLGLSISAKLATMMGGRLWAESEKGCGTSFYLELELPKGLKEMEQAQLPAIKNNIKSMNLLVVDDVDMNRTLIKAYLKDYKVTFFEASDGVEAIKIYREQVIDFILMDIQMPVMDGNEATIEIRKIEKEFAKKCCPIIALSANALNEEKEVSIKSGVDAYLTKPIKKQVLLETISKYQSK